ncbi:hypothetical protein F4809DRAFT_125862 [Biscogniauxia mediterranea]|nr:hypothetical protein F4809DRAFT_125862 [Biscogniauxia mediterranea]
MKGRCSPFALLVVLGSLGSSICADEGLSRRGVDNPGPDDFVRRSGHSVAVIGDYVYIDGGEVSSRVNGSDPSASPYVAVNTTLSLSLKESWTNDTVELRSIPKTAPLLNKQIYWTDLSTSSLYAWGGMTSAGLSLPPTNEIWRFGADGQGGGAWSQVTQQDYLDFSKLVRPSGSAFTQSQDIGYALGGEATTTTDSAIQKQTPGYALQGLVSYNFRTGQWTNSSSTSYGGYGTSLNARAEYVPYGSNGLLLFLGGAETPVDATNETIVQVNWNTVTLYDPATQSWYQQSTTGTRPPTMEGACSVGVRGPNNTYEIFIYGGVSDQIRATSSDVHVLSLPGFVFFKSPSSGTPRSDHECAVVGKGKRQLLSVGGVDGEFRNYTSPTTADPWTQGLGIYDMSEMRWTSSFDPDAADYISPVVVNEWYAHGGLRNMRWDNNKLKDLFVNGSTNTGDENASTDSTTNSTPTNAIIGGVVGGVAGAVAIGAIVVWMVKRRRGQNVEREDTIDDGIPEYRPEPWPKDGRDLQSPMSGFTDGTVVEMSRTWIEELPGEEVEGRGELPGSEVSKGEELPGPVIEGTYELPAPVEAPRPELPDRKYTS